MRRDDLIKLKTSEICSLSGLVLERDSFCRSTVLPLGGPVVRKEHYLVFKSKRVPVSSVADLLKAVTTLKGISDKALAKEYPAALAAAIASIDGLGIIPDFDDAGDPISSSLRERTEISPVGPAFDGRYLSFGAFISVRIKLKRYWDTYKYDILERKCELVSRQEM